MPNIEHWPHLHNGAATGNMRTDEPANVQTKFILHDHVNKLPVVLLLLQLLQLFIIFNIGRHVVSNEAISIFSMLLCHS